MVLCVISEHLLLAALDTVLKNRCSKNFQIFLGKFQSRFFFFFFQNMRKRVLFINGLDLLKIKKQLDYNSFFVKFWLMKKRKGKIPTIFSKIFNTSTA